MNNLTTNSLVVADISVKIDAEGRYCLNDLHRAAGGESRHEPNRYLRGQQAIELIEELLTTQIPVVSLEGRYGGTYVCKELIYAYAMWISPSFHLKVIRAYDEIATQGGHISPTATPEQAKRLAIRAKGIATRHEFTAVLKDHDVTGKGYAQCTDAINAPILGAPAAMVKVQNGLTAKANLRDTLTNEQLTIIALSEMVAARRITEQNTRGNRPCSDVCGNTARAIMESVR